MKKEKKAKFNPHDKPRFYGIIPEEFLNDDKLVKTIEISEGEFDISILDPNFRYSFEFDHDYGGCYYPGDTPSISVNLNVYNKGTVRNEHYEKQLNRYKLDKSKHLKAVKEWNIAKKQYDLTQEEMKKQKELDLYNKLKKKFESAN